MFRFLSVVPVLVAACGFLFGQTFTASIAGIVTDPTGAVISGATVTVTDLARNVNYRTVSNDTGFYMVSELPPGTYRVAAEQAGFRRFVLEPLPLATQQKATVNIRLDLGQLSEQISVTAQAQLIESGSSTLSAVVENKRIVDLPLNGRNIYQLAALVPGVFFVRQLTGIADTFTANRFIVNGGQESTSDMVLDGVTATVSHNISTIPAVSAIPSVEGIHEFRIQTNAYAAEYGRSGGGLVSMVTKSGTNEFHGSLYEFLRNSRLDANNFFANRAGRPLGSFKRNQFGGSVGGPIWVPKLYKGRDRSFFFADYEGTRLRNARLAQHTVPTALERRGDFSQTRAADGQMKVIYNPFTTRPDPARPGRFIRDPFPGNVIPQSLLDPVAVKLQEFYPAPNSPGLPNTNQQNLFLQDSYPEFADRIEFKLDHNLTERRRVFGRYTYMDSIYSKPNFWKNIADPGCCDPMNQRLQNAAFDYTETLSPTSILNFRYGLGRVSGNRVPWSASLTGVGGFEVASLGMPKIIDEISNHRVFPTITIQDHTQLGPNTGDIYFMGDTTHSVIANLSQVKGRHSLKYGVDLRINFVNYGQLGGPSGSFHFERAMTQGPDPRVPGAIAGVGYASFLLGTASGSGGPGGGSNNITHQIRPANANRYFAFYVQDDFKLDAKLTLNLGFRWDFEGGVTERYNFISAIDPLVRNPLSDKVGMDLRGGYLFAGESLGRRGIRTTDARQLNPRFGLAYELDSKTVIRAGYGIFFGLPSYAANSGYTGGAFSSNTPFLFAPDGITPHHLLRNPFPEGFNLPRGSADDLLTQVGQSLAGGWPQALLPTYNQQWNFTIQRSLGRDMVWEIAYAGNKGSKLALTAQLNQLDPQFLSLGDRLLDLVPNPFFGLINVGVLAQPTVQYGQLLRPFPHFTSVSATNAAWANSNYHALQTRFEKRYSAGLSLLASYTWSKTITDGADGLWNRPGNDMTNWYCRACDRAVSSYDQPHRFVSNFTYELPVGRGKSFGANWKGWLDNVLGQWQVNSILTLSAGQPLRFYLPQNTCFCFGGQARPEWTGASADLGSKRTLERWFDTAQFKQPASFTFGNLARNVAQLRNDGANNIDLSLFKSFRPTEGLEIEFRAEAFNFTNTPLFSPPGTTLNAPTFGVVTSQENSPRQIQFGLKIIF